jgi:hypothetical protein
MGASVPAMAPRAGGYLGPGCPHCGRVLDLPRIVSGPQTCAWCRRSFEGVRFDPAPPDLTVRRTAEAGPEGAHACANHPGNVAASHCSRCGVFMCALCRIEVDGMGLCPACFDRLVGEGALPSAIATYRDYGRLATALAALGLLLIFVGPVAGPAAIYYGRKRLQQLTALKETGGRAGMVAVMILGALDAIGGVALIVTMVRS